MKNDRIYLDHILECIGWIESFTAEGRDAFLKDRKTQSAVLRGLQTLAESTQRLTSSPSDNDWRDPKNISGVPREIVFLDLPGEVEAKAKNLPETKLIPTAAEFVNEKIVPLYERLTKDSGERPPNYPEGDESPEGLRKARKKYWSWFDENFSATRAMVTVEEAASENGRIQWIDYRIPLTKDGDTLHLHVCPAGKYDSGVLAYNFIKRGYKHGIRLVGTLKSEPDMNVLAIYDK